MVWKSWGSFLSHFLRPFTADQLMWVSRFVSSDLFFFGLRCGRKFDGESFLIWIATNDTTMIYPGHTILTWDCPLGCFYQKCFQFSSWTFPIRRWAVHNWFIASSWVQNPPWKSEAKKRPKHQADLRFDPLAFQSYLLSFGVWLVWFLGSPLSYLLTWKVFGSLGDRHKKTRKKYVWLVDFFGAMEESLQQFCAKWQLDPEAEHFLRCDFFLGNGVAVESLHHLRFSLKIHSETEWTMTTYIH